MIKPLPVNKLFSCIRAPAANAGSHNCRPAQERTSKIYILLQLPPMLTAYCKGTKLSFSPHHFFPLKCSSFSLITKL